MSVSEIVTDDQDSLVIPAGTHYCHIEVSDGTRFDVKMGNIGPKLQAIGAGNILTNGGQIGLFGRVA